MVPGILFTVMIKLRSIGSIDDDVPITQSTFASANTNTRYASRDDIGDNYQGACLLCTR